MPIVSVYEDTPEKKVNLQELFKNKRGVLFSVVGAFTPGCTTVISYIIKAITHAFVHPYL